MGKTNLINETCLREALLVDLRLASGHETCLGETVLVRGHEACLAETITVLVIGNKAGVVEAVLDIEATLLKTGLANGSKAALVIASAPVIGVRSTAIGAGAIGLRGGRWVVATERMKILALRC